MKRPYLFLVPCSLFLAATASAVTATKAYVDSRDAATLSAAQTAITAATNGLVTASVTNGLASAASVAQEAKDRAAAIKAEREARESAGYLTAESDPSTALTNGVAWVRGRKVISEHQSLDAYLKTADLAANEADPVFAAWKDGASIVAGKDATAIFGGVVIGDGAKGGGVVIGENADSGPGPNVVIGKNSGSGHPYSIVIGSIDYWSDNHRTEAQGEGTFNISTADPAHFYFGAANIDSAGNSITPRTLQSYLDERATTNDLEAVKAMISETNETFASAVLQVGIGTLGITTNDLQVVHDLAELPVGTSITTVGGLLAALAAGLAALKKSVSSLSSKVDDANAALEEVA